MATQPRSPLSRAPAAPPRRDYTVVWVLLGVVLLAGVLMFSGLFIFARYLARNIGVDVRDRAGNKSVNIETPVGSLRVNQGEISEAQLGLPVYPGSRRKKKDGATVSLEVPSEKSVRIVAGEFETDAAFDEVADFYRQKLAGARFTVERGTGGYLKLEIADAGRRRVVVVRREGGVTRIALVNILEGGAGAIN